MKANHGVFNCVIVTFIFLLPWILAAQQNNPNLDSAYVHLNEIMDQYHKTFDVYTNHLAGGNNFHPTVIGDYENISLDTESSNASPFGSNCIEVEYAPNPSSINKWAAIQWMFPDTNWGYWQGHNITGAERITFKAKGHTGGVKVEFKLGGVNRKPYHNPNRDYQDSFDLLSTGIETLKTDWQDYSIDLTDTNYFAVYMDGNGGSNNRYIPSGWYNGNFNMQVNPNWTINPCAGNSCLKVTWNGFAGIDGYKWNGIVWQFPPGNWGEQSGYDLTGATKLTFCARTDEPGLKLKFFVGLDNIDSCDEVPISWVTIIENWQQYTIDLKGKNLSNIRGGFGFVFNDVNDPNPDGTVFYLDEIKFDLPLSHDLSNIIAGFICSMSEADNPQGCKFYIDDIQYQLSPEAKELRLNSPRFLESYVVTQDTIDKYIRSIAFTYDNALAMLAYIAGDKQDYWHRAKLIGESYINAIENDQDFTDGRLRNAYKSGDLINPQSMKATLPILSDEINYGTHTGNMAWTMIALLAYYQKYNEKFGITKDDFLSAAERIAQWIYENCYDEAGPGGYTGGFEGYGHSKVLWKSIEHNIDVYGAFSKLHSADGEQKWYDRAMHAKEFVEALYDKICPCIGCDSGQYYFIIGTKNLTDINCGPVVEDAQTWAMMTFQDKKYFPNIDWSKEYFKTTNNGFAGIDFNNDHDGIWFEGTAHMAIACYMIGDSITYQFLLDELRKAQTSSNLNSNGKGIVAASKDRVTTGLNWTYNNRLHIGATAWYILAELKWNPYAFDSIISDVENKKLLGSTLPEQFDLLQNYPNPFNPSTKICFHLPKSGNLTLEIYSTTGQLVRTLVKGNRSAGTYEVEWDGLDDRGYVAASGLYFIKFSGGNDFKIKKMLLIR